MKRIGNLYESVISLENLQLADERARKGKVRSYGVQLHDKNREANLLQLHNDLKNQTFKTSNYHIFKIYEPKEREIFRLPYFPDRITHHAIMNVLEPIWVSLLNKNTYSCIKNRGIHAATKNMKHVLCTNKDGTRYCLKIDVKKFYPSIDHDILKQVIRRRIKDKRLLWLLDEIVDSVPIGVPIGNYLSQYFANIYLAYFDHWLKEEKRVKYYWLYADDIVILAPNKEVLHELLHDIRAYLRDNLNLKVKRNYQVFPTNVRGIDFLGYRFFHTHTILRKSIKKKLFRRVGKLKKRKIVPKKEVYKQQICSWWGWCKYCNSINLMSKVQKIFLMKLSSIAPNARYDLVHGKPFVFEKDNDGSHLYRFNIEPEMGIPDGEEKEVQIGWTCCEIRIWETPSKSTLKKTIIRSIVDDSAEFNLVNAYNKHVLGIKVDATAVDKYKEYLLFTEDVEMLLVNDFLNETN